MKKRSGKQYCTLDHANKRRELARQTPYEFWLRQASRKARESLPPARPDGSRRQRSGG
jgi:hypothetical protein